MTVQQIERSEKTKVHTAEIDGVRYRLIPAVEYFDKQRHGGRPVTREELTEVLTMWQNNVKALRWWRRILRRLGFKITPPINTIRIRLK